MNLAVALSAAFTFALIPAMTAAQTFDSPPPVGAPRPLVVAAPSVDTLSNGLRVVVATRKTLPLVTVELLVRSGAETDPPSLAGLADITATLLTKGTATRTAPQIAEAAEALGGVLDSGAGWDRSQVAMTVTRPQVAAALALVADVVRHPRFLQAELNRARRQARDGLAVALGEPGSLARMAVDRAAFGSGAFGHPAGGTPEGLARIKRADVLALHAAWYRPDNATLIFAGDIDAAEAKALAEAAFGTWKRPAEPLPRGVRDDTRARASAPIAIDMEGAGQAGVALAAPTIARDAPDFYAGVVANALLGGGYSSRLNQELRIRRGLTYGVGSSLDARRSAGVWRIAAQTKNESAAEFVAVTLDEVKRVGATAAPADELEARKLSVIGTLSRRYETTSSLAGAIAALEATNVPPVEITRTIDAVRAVTPAEVMDFARKHWVVDRLAIVVAGDAGKFADALRAQHPALRTLPQAEVDLDRADLTRPAAAGRPSRP